MKFVWFYTDIKKPSRKGKNTSDTFHVLCLLSFHSWKTRILYKLLTSEETGGVIRFKSYSSRLFESNIL